jgi:hypothetical protein
MICVSSVGQPKSRRVVVRQATKVEQSDFISIWGPAVFAPQLSIVRCVSVCMHAYIHRTSQSSIWVYLK